MQRVSAESQPDATRPPELRKLQVGSRNACITLDLEFDFAGALPHQRAQGLENAAGLIDIIKDLKIPLTVFVQGKLLEEHAETVEAFRSAGAEFHLHSYSHPLRRDGDPRQEVIRGVSAFEEFFGERPLGYRFPLGDILPEDYSILEEQGFAFDASIFPSWRPGHFNHLGKPVAPYLPPESTIVELPFSTISESIRIPHSLSYSKLLGGAYFTLLRRARPPETIVYDLHLVDLHLPESARDLPLSHRLIYSRNKMNGEEFLHRFLDYVASLPHDFATVSEVYHELDGGSP